jgi:hypothetical protein
MRNLQAERLGRSGRHLVCALFHSLSLPMSRDSGRHLSRLPHGLRPTGSPLRILAAVPGVLSPEQPTETPVWLVRGQDLLGHPERLRRFHGPHEGHCAGLFSSGDCGARRRGFLLAGACRDALRQSKTEVHRPQPLSAGLHDAYSGWTRQPDAEQTNCEIPMTPDHAL